MTREQLIWFLFQKTKYVHEEGKFKLLEFATDRSYGHYHRWKGYLDETEVAAARQMYNKNKYGGQGGGEGRREDQGKAEGGGEEENRGRREDQGKAEGEEEGG